MLKIKNLTVTLEEHTLLDNINLEINPGEIHAVMGPKFSGKSDLAQILIGNPYLDITEGDILYKNKSILDKSIEKRSLLGIYGCVQHPPYISGVTNFELILSAFETRKKLKNLNELEQKYTNLCQAFDLPVNLKNKSVNDDNISSSEKQINEIIQMILFNPALVILDEIDENFTEEETVKVGTFLKSFLLQNKKSAIIISKNHLLLDILNPDHVHILVNGVFKEHGTTELYKRIVEDGYSQFS